MPYDHTDEGDLNAGYYGQEAENAVLKHQFAQCDKNCKLGTEREPCWWQNPEATSSP